MKLLAVLLAVTSLAAGFLLVPRSSHAGAGGGCSGNAGSEVHRAGLVVSFGGQQPTQRFCIEFTEESISGIELLQRSGLSLVTQIEGGLGAGVCQIDGVGSDDPTDCFKYSTTPPFRFWVYFRWTEAGAWQFSNLGASTRVIRDGDIDGWSWGNGAGSVPESPDGVLDPPAPTVAASTHTPTPPSATNTPRPTATRVPTKTPATESTASATTVVTVPTGASTPAAPSAASPAAVQVATRQPDAAVAGAQATPSAEDVAPASTTPDAQTRTPAASPTPRGGVIVVDPTQAGDNEATAERTDGRDGGGGRAALVGFTAVAVVLAGGAGVLWYRRRGVDA